MFLPFISSTGRCGKPIEDNSLGLYYSHTTAKVLKCRRLTDVGESWSRK